MSSTGHPLSPPGGQHGMPQLVAPRPQGLDSNQLKARLYAKSEIHTSTRPVLKVVRRRPRKDEVRRRSSNSCLVDITRASLENASSVVYLNESYTLTTSKEIDKSPQNCTALLLFWESPVLCIQDLCTSLVCT